MHWWRMAATVFASAFVLGLAGLLTARAIPWVYDPARTLVVGAGSLLAGTLVAGIWTTLARRVDNPHLRDGRPLVSMHPRKRG